MRKKNEDLVARKNPEMNSKMLRKRTKIRLLKDEVWVYYNTVLAHRSYLLAMSMYKFTRYGIG
jgi:hypothetical protein